MDISLMSLLCIQGAFIHWQYLRKLHFSPTADLVALVILWYSQRIMAS
jgi:hypothetical protein